MNRIREWMRDPRVAGVLAAAAVLFVGYRVYSIRAGTPAPKEVPAVSAAGETPPEAQAVPTGEETSAPAPKTPAHPKRPIRWSWDRNPFLPSDSGRPSADRSAKTKGPEADRKGLADLRGTVITRGLGIAIFGDRLVPSGGTIAGWTVVEVDPYVVSLRRGTETRRVEMFKPAP